MKKKNRAKSGNPALHIPGGFRVGGIAAGIKSSTRPDLGIILCERPAAVGVALTTNLFKAAPIQLCARRLMRPPASCRGVIVNSGNANALTGEQGMKDAEEMAALAEKASRCPPGSFLVASTGVIGKAMPMDKVRAGVPKLAKNLSSDGWNDFARAIMTTDLTMKISSRTILLPDGSPLGSVLGIAKGSGMIQPNMATMLAFILTDFPLNHTRARTALMAAVEDSFNSLTVDGQTSTNDMALLLGSELMDAKEPYFRKGYDQFKEALTEVCGDLARAIARDGEGATKLVEVRVMGAKTIARARTLALEVANSPLVKTAIYGADPNWGRITQALGKAGVHFFSDEVSIKIQGVQVLAKGLPTPFDRALLSKAMKEKDVLIEASVGPGPKSARVWTCDLTEGYIKINAEYN